MARDPRPPVPILALTPGEDDGAPGGRGGATRLAPVHLAGLGLALVLAALVAWPGGEARSGTAFARGQDRPSAPTAAGALADVLAHQAEHDRRLAREANAVLSEILGPACARVSVRSAWDFTRHTLKSEKPGRRVVLHEARTEVEPGEPAVREEKDYSAALSSEERVHVAPRLVRLSVALFLDPAVPDSPELRAALQAAVGFDEQRGDEFRTVVLPFARAIPAPAPAGPARAPLAWLRDAGLGLAAGLALLLAWGRLRRSPHASLPARAPETSAPPRPEPALAARARVQVALASEPARVGAILSRWAREEPAESLR